MIVGEDVGAGDEVLEILTVEDGAVASGDAVADDAVWVTSQTGVVTRVAVD